MSAVTAIKFHLNWKRMLNNFGIQLGPVNNHLWSSHLKTALADPLYTILNLVVSLS